MHTHMVIIKTTIGLPGISKNVQILLLTLSQSNFHFSYIDLISILHVSYNKRRKHNLN